MRVWTFSVFLGSYLKAGDWWGSSLRRIRTTLCSTKKKIRLFGCCFVFSAFFSVGCCPCVASTATLCGSQRVNFLGRQTWKGRIFPRRQLLFFLCVCPHFKYPYTMYYRIFVKEFYFYLKRTAAAAARLKGKKKKNPKNLPTQKRQWGLGCRVKSDGAHQHHTSFSLSLSLSLDYYYQKPELLPFKIRGQQ